MRLMVGVGKKFRIKKIRIAFESILILLISVCGDVLAGTTPGVPDNLKVTVNEIMSIEVPANGVQIYECKASEKDPTHFEWVFKAPDAALFDNTGKMIGRHYAGPTWESRDGSKVTGVVKAQYDGPDPEAIPWLLLTAKSTSGNGIFSRVTSIQRLMTVGGKPPKECNQAMAGKKSRIQYKATYYFYVPKP